MTNVRPEPGVPGDPQYAISALNEKPGKPRCEENVRILTDAVTVTLSALVVALRHHADDTEMIHEARRDDEIVVGLVVR